MPNIERRRDVVTLYPGDYEQKLTALLNETLEAQRKESAGSARQSSRSKAIALAREYDALLAKAVGSGVEVTVWAISYLHWGPLADEHPPREDESDDQKRGLNLKTFPPALLRASLVAPGEAQSLDDLKVKGEAALLALGDLSRSHYAKIETAAWNVNVGDVELPKDFSLVSLLKEARETGSEPPDASESAPAASKAGSRPKRTSTTTPKET